MSRHNVVLTDTSVIKQADLSAANTIGLHEIMRLQYFNGIARLLRICETGAYGLDLISHAVSHLRLGYELLEKASIENNYADFDSIVVLLADTIRQINEKLPKKHRFNGAAIASSDDIDAYNNTSREINLTYDVLSLANETAVLQAIARKGGHVALAELEAKDECQSVSYLLANTIRLMNSGTAGLNFLRSSRVDGALGLSSYELTLRKYPGSLLHEAIKTSPSLFTPQIKNLIAYMLLDALHFLHTNVGVLHNDIKPGNIIIDVEMISYLKDSLENGELMSDVLLALFNNQALAHTVTLFDYGGARWNAQNILFANDYVIVSPAVDSVRTVAPLEATAEYLPINPEKNNQVPPVAGGYNDLFAICKTICELFLGANLTFLNSLLEAKYLKKPNISDVQWLIAALQTNGMHYEMAKMVTFNLVAILDGQHCIESVGQAPFDLEQLLSLSRHILNAPIKEA